ncbi:MAG: anaerobic ribonucleoside-triphosphate reductase [Promicromonosporaceae bacterium]|nr:anaerobic ribonucleoside-triphosphate reductase [Promicromonosporaceae bacterium]
MTLLDPVTDADVLSTVFADPPTVIKRDGRKALYNAARIRDAVLPAWRSAYNGDIDEGAFNQAVDAIDAQVRARYDSGAVEVWEIESIVEQTLVSQGHAPVTEHYATYRVQRARQRTEAMSVEHQVGRLTSSEVKHENANKDARVYHVQRDRMAGSVAKAKGMAMLPRRVAEAHAKGQIHYHDLDYSPYTPFTNCSLPNFEGMLRDGFTMGSANIETPKSILTASSVLAQIIVAVSSAQYGGITVESIDRLLAPYAVRSHEKHLADAANWIPGDDAQAVARREEFARSHTVKDIYDALQSLLFNLNTTCSTQGQTPFISFGFGLGTSWFEREVQKAVLAVQLRGLGAEGRTPIFPKLIFTLRRGVNLEPSDPNYDIKQLAIECSTKRMYPDVISYDKIVEITGSWKTPMGCRSFLQGWTNEQGESETIGRMNLGVVTLNLPRIALETRGDLDGFWRLLDERLTVMREALAYRVQSCVTARPENAPILYQNGGFGSRLEAGESVLQLFRDGRGTVSLGYIGLYEVATVFFGAEWESLPEAKDFTLAIIRRMKNAAGMWTSQSNDGVWRSVYATPSESLTDRFARMDLEKFGPVENITDKGYYTNSFHFDVRKNPTPFEKIDFEMDYPLAGSSGGFIHYVEYPVMTSNPKALEAVWDYAYDRVGYLGTNTPIDKCYTCGFTGDCVSTDDGFMCPTCGETDGEALDVVKRVCGYLGSPAVRPWVKGRRLEHSARVRHVLTPETLPAEAAQATACGRTAPTATSFEFQVAATDPGLPGEDGRGLDGGSTPAAAPTGQAGQAGQAGEEASAQLGIPFGEFPSAYPEPRESELRRPPVSASGDEGDDVLFALPSGK